MQFSSGRRAAQPLPRLPKTPKLGILTAVCWLISKRLRSVSASSPVNPVSPLWRRAFRPARRLQGNRRLVPQRTRLECFGHSRVLPGYEKSSKWGEEQVAFLKSLDAPHRWVTIHPRRARPHYQIPWFTQSAPTSSSQYMAPAKFSRLNNHRQPNCCEKTQRCRNYNNIYQKLTLREKSMKNLSIIAPVSVKILGFTLDNQIALANQARYALLPDTDH